jgi:hypothetical protein
MYLLVIGIKSGELVPSKLLLIGVCFRFISLQKSFAATIFTICRKSHPHLRKTQKNMGQLPLTLFERKPL